MIFILIIQNILPGRKNIFFKAGMIYILFYTISFNFILYYLISNRITLNSGRIIMILGSCALIFHIMIIIYQTIRARYEGYVQYL